MYETHVSVVGNLVADPVLRETDRGRKVASFRVAVTERRWNPEEKAHVDGRTSFFGVSCWGYLATNVAECLGKGDRVVVSGRLSVREYQVDDTHTRNSVDIEATAVGHDLTFGTTKFVRVIRSAHTEAAAGGPDTAEADPFATGEYVEVDGLAVDRDGVVHSTVPA